MSRGTHRFRQTDVTKAVTAVANAGVTVGRVEITADGRIVVVAVKPGQEQDAVTVNEWDSVK